MRKYVKRIVITMIVLIVSGCSSASSNKVLTVTDNQFDSQSFHNAIAKIVVENGFEGYTFKTSTGSSTMNWQSIISGSIDLDIESWTANVATYEQDKKDGTIVDIGILVPDSQQGYYVPRYVIEGDASRNIEAVAPDLKTVEDLKKYPQLFKNDENPNKGRIYGGVAGWMIDEILYKKFLFYHLDESFDYFRMGSESTLFASLSAAYNKGEPWVGYCYEPTWIAGKLDLVRLTDTPYDAATYQEGGSDFPLQELKIVGNKSFKTDFPELVDFFSKFKTNRTLVNEALAYMNEKQASYEETAIWMLKENPELLDSWLDSKQAAKVTKYLGTK